MPKQNKDSKLPNDVDDKREESEGISKTITKNENADDDANNEVGRKDQTDVANKKPPAIFNLGYDLSEIFNYYWLFGFYIFTYWGVVCY